MRQRSPSVCKQVECQDARRRRASFFFQQCYTCPRRVRNSLSLKTGLEHYRARESRVVRREHLAWQWRVTAVELFQHRATWRRRHRFSVCRRASPSQQLLSQNFVCRLDRAFVLANDRLSLGGYFRIRRRHDRNRTRRHSLTAPARRFQFFALCAAAQTRHSARTFVHARRQVRSRAARYIRTRLRGTRRVPDATTRALSRTNARARRIHKHRERFVGCDSPNDAPATCSPFRFGWNASRAKFPLRPSYFSTRCGTFSRVAFPAFCGILSRKFLRGVLCSTSIPNSDAR